MSQNLDKALWATANLHFCMVRLAQVLSHPNGDTLSRINQKRSEMLGGLIEAHNCFVTSLWQNLADYQANGMAFTTLPPLMPLAVAPCQNTVADVGFWLALSQAAFRELFQSLKPEFARLIDIDDERLRHTMVGDYHQVYHGLGEALSVKVPKLLASE